MTILAVLTFLAVVLQCIFLAAEGYRLPNRGVINTNKPSRFSYKSTTSDVLSSSKVSTPDPLLLRVARGEKAERTPVWMMRQAGRHMKAYRDLCAIHKTFRERSEIVEVATEIRSGLH
jgi:hypothetical protein